MKIYSTIEVAKTMADYAASQITWSRELSKHSNKWCLIQVKVDDIPTIYDWVDYVSNKDLKNIDPSDCDVLDVNTYVRMRKRSPFPPIVLPRIKTGWIQYPIEGNHRVRAAQLVGDKYIDAFVPIEDVKERVL